MSRYFTQAYLPLYVEGLWDGEPQRHQPTVSEHVAVDTGLVDARGDAIMRAPEPIGFHSPRR